MSTNTSLTSSFLLYPWRWLLALLFVVGLTLPLIAESPFILDESLPHLAVETVDSSGGG